MFNYDQDSSGIVRFLRTLSAKRHVKWTIGTWWKGRFAGISLHFLVTSFHLLGACTSAGQVFSRGLKKFSRGHSR